MTRLFTILWGFLLGILVPNTGQGQTPSNDPLDQVRILLDSSQQLLRSDPKSVHLIIDQALTLAPEKTPPLLLSKLHNNYALAYYFLGEIDSSIFQYQKSLDFAVVAEDQRQQAILWKNLGIAYRVRSLYDKAIDCYQKALQLNESIGASKEIASINNSIGNIYYLTQFYDRAQGFYTKALSFWVAENDSFRVSKVFNNLGLIYWQQGGRSEALEAYQKSISFNPQNDNALKNLGQNLLALDRLDEAILNLKQAEEIRVNKGDKNGLASVLNQLAELDRKRGSYIRSEQHLNDALQLLEATGDQKVLLENHQIRKKLLADRGNYKEALGLTEYIRKIDSALFKEQSINVLELQSYYQQQEQESEKRILAQENQLIKSEQEQQALVIRGGLVIGALLLVTVLILWFAVSHNRKKNLALEELNQIVNAQKEEISHRNKNGFTRISLLVKDLIKISGDSEIKDNLRQVESMVFGLANLENYLYLNPNAKSAIRALPFLDMLTKEIDRSFKLPDQKIDYQLNVGAEVTFEPNYMSIISLLVTELTINSYKYAFETIRDGIIKLDLHTSQGGYKLTYEDNGKGFNFTETSEGRGLKIIKDLSRQLKAHVTYDPQKKQGMSCTIAFEMT